MANDLIGLDEPAVPDHYLDTESLDVEGNTVHRERVQIAGGTAPAIAPVDATLGLTVDVADRAARDIGIVDIGAALPSGSNTIGVVDLGATDNAVLDAIQAAVEGTITVDNGGTFAVQEDGAALTALQIIDNPVLVDDAAFTPGTSSVMMAGFEFDDATSDSVDEGDAGAARMSANRNIYTQIRDAAGNERGANVDASNQLLVAEANSAAILADTANIDTNVGTVAGAVSGSEMQVDIVADGAGLATAANQAVMTGWDNAASDGASVSGDVAHDTADAGEPVKVGHKAIAHSTNPTAVAANDRTDSYANRHGIPWVMGGHPNLLTTQLNVTDADGAQTDTAIITVGSGSKIVVTWISVTADNANTGDVQCRIGFGTTNTPGNDAADVILSHPGIASGSGLVIGSGAGMIGVGADGEDLRVTCEDPAGGSLDIVVGYYTIES